MSEHSVLPGKIMPEGKSEVLDLQPLTSMEVVHAGLVREQNNLADSRVIERFWIRQVSLVDAQVNSETDEKTKNQLAIKLEMYKNQLESASEKVALTAEFVAYLEGFKEELKALVEEGSQS